VRLSEDVYLVGGGPVLGFGLSPGQDGHIYLLVSEGEAAFIDCGLGTTRSRHAVLGNVALDGLERSWIKILLLTHYHPDHAGGAADWRDELDLEVSASAEAVAALESADVVATGLQAAQNMGLYDRNFELKPVKIGRALADGERIEIGRLRATFISTPGHCHGHGCYLVQGGSSTYLFSGDCVLHGGSIILQNVPDCDIAAYASSVARLAELEFDALLPGHGSISLTEGKQHVLKAATAFGGVGLPRMYA
jgi:hydroxyacylglutathione hydrolase